MELKSKIALVTGSGSGIGKAIALAFAGEGADVAINGSSHPDRAEATAAEIRAMGRRSMAIKADVSSEEEVNQMVARVIREWGGIDILVNNSGIGYIRMVEDMTAAEWHHVIGVNLDGVFYTSKAVIGTMKSRGGGRIINISSISAKRVSMHACAGYTSSKAAVLAFTRHLAFEVGPYKITVNAICPGFVMTAKMFDSPEQIKIIKNKMPLKDMASSEDIADAAVFLASDKARMITGTTLDVDAGQSIAYQDWETYARNRKEALAKGTGAH